MIRNEKELREAQARLADFKEQIKTTRDDLEAQGTPPEHTQLAVDPLEVMAAELEFDIQLFERLRREGVSAVASYPSEDSGKELIALRIARGWTQKQLAEALEVSEAQVSRDERNDYQGVTQERRARILAALGIEEERSFRPKAESAVIIELPMQKLEAASFRGPLPTVRSTDAKRDEDAQCSPKTG